MTGWFAIEVSGSPPCPEGTTNGIKRRVEMNTRNAKSAMISTTSHAPPSDETNGRARY
jgi:hypothetical protein